MGQKVREKDTSGLPRRHIRDIRVYCPITNKVSTSRDVIIMEEVSIPVTENKECNEENLGSVGDISSGDLEDNLDETYIEKANVTYINPVSMKVYETLLYSLGLYLNYYHTSELGES